MQRITRCGKIGIEDPRLLQRDACGVGFVADIQGVPSHEIIADGGKILKALSHRGGRGSDPRTSDGVGMMLQVPVKLLKREMGSALDGLQIGGFAVAQVFLPKCSQGMQKCKDLINRLILQEELEAIAWRQVPVNSTILGEQARACEPNVMQVIIGRGANQANFEWRLYVLRRLIEVEASRSLSEYEKRYFYLCSLSSKTIVYKGLLLAETLSDYYLDLKNEDCQSAFSMVHQRFSTNTLPAWHLAQPFRTICHNGEINTIRGNINWMFARQTKLSNPQIDADLQRIGSVMPVADSDSAILDSTVEFLHRAGREIPEVMSMLIPEPWERRQSFNKKLRDYYEYQSCLMEPWDGPAFVGFSNGSVIGAVLDRNGLRPGRYCVTANGKITMASEAGVLDLPSEEIVYRGRLQPGKMFLIDMEHGCIVSDEEIKGQLSNAKPYGRWLDEHRLTMEALISSERYHETLTGDILKAKQELFGYTLEEKQLILRAMASTGKEPTGSMGNDTPLAVLSEQPQLLYNYFKQLFAQVTNPPIDAIREEMVTSLSTLIGAQGNLLEAKPEHCHLLRLEQPILSNSDLARLGRLYELGLKVVTLPMVFSSDLESGLEHLVTNVVENVRKGCQVIVLSDRSSRSQHLPIPALLAVSAVHHQLIREGLRMDCSIIVESGEPREIHHFALLIGYGASAINPYVALDTIRAQDKVEGYKDSCPVTLQANYIKAIGLGLKKIMSKMGISTLQSYHGSQIFEAIGLSQTLVDRYFTWTTTRIEGIGLKEIEHDTIRRVSEKNQSGGEYSWRQEGEKHLHGPAMISSLQNATRINSRAEFKRYCEIVDRQAQEKLTLRGLLTFKKAETAIPIDEVEPVVDIVKRFSTGAMSFGSISKESHETIAVAMNRFGGKSNSGEGGEDPDRFFPDESGDWRRSAVKQIASGRFGVDSYYLANADELQIKIAQGAKPGEGGQLPGHKVDVTIASVRKSTPGVTLISPPPHHDIYSIEDLAQLIFDLKNANPRARISVKLVSAAGVGTIAAGVAKAKADAILISGYEGGTGASPLTSIKHTGVPWELGLADSHRILVENGLRHRVVLQTDGQIRTARDIAVATLLGAEEWSVGTGALIVLGCVMMRKCHLNTCPVGIATQNPILRKRFRGQPEHLINYFFLLAEELREIMAELGFRSINEMVGRSDRLQQLKSHHFKWRTVDLSSILRSAIDQGLPKYFSLPQDHELDNTIDAQFLIPKLQKSIRFGKPTILHYVIKNTDRSVGTRLSYEISKHKGGEGLSDDTIKLHFEGSAGQSFMAFATRGISARIEGEVNDYCGKGLSGAQIVVVPPKDSSIIPELNVICGNVTLYGATAGQLFVRGIAGERFAVRNSGATAIVEGLGDHGCEYMTGGRVVVLGPTGVNFAAGMSGGVAYVFDIDHNFSNRVNHEMVRLELLDNEDELVVNHLVKRHFQLTSSRRALEILNDWDKMKLRFLRVIPTSYSKKRRLDQAN